MAPTGAPRWLRRRWRSGARLDVVFYTPWIGVLLSPQNAPLPGGAETQVLMLAKALVQRGLRVGIIAFGTPEELPAETDGVKIVARTPYRKRRGPHGALLETLAVLRSLWSASSSAVVFRGVGLELALLGLYCRLAGRRLVLSSANVVDFDCRKLLRKARDARMYEFGVRLADEIVVQTDEQTDLCLRSFGRHPRLIKSMCALTEPQTREAEAFLWVGRLVSYKRPLEFIELARALPHARFWMVGVPPVLDIARPAADAAIAEASTVPNLTLFSPRPRGEVEELMSRAVASVNTADYEGMPNVLLEAWKQGVPALVLTHDPDGVVGTYGLGGFADGSRAALAELAREQWRTRNDPTERRAVAERCRTYIQHNHSPDLVAGQWIEVLGEPSPQGRREDSRGAARPKCVG